MGKKKGGMKEVDLLNIENCMENGFLFPRQLAIHRCFGLAMAYTIETNSASFDDYSTQI